MAFTNITDEELDGLGVTGLPDTPGLSTEAMQEKFDEYSVFLKDKFKNLIDELEALTAAVNIGAVVPQNITADSNIQSILDGLRQYVDDTVVAIGTGDMATGVYDPDRDGVIAPDQGGTGQTTLQATRNAMGLGNTTGALPVANGGTGKTTNTSNSVLVGNGTNAVKNIASGNGALYATSANGAPQFGTLQVAQGGTGLTAQPSMLTKLDSTAAGNVLVASPRPGVTGTLGTGNGGTGITSNPSMLTKLDSTSAANVFTASPRPGVTGTLGVANGGTGQTTKAGIRNTLGLGNTTGALPVANGGTGKTSHTKNAIVYASDTTAIGNLATASGALYATSANGAPAFGTLPAAQGGTGNTSLQATRNAMGLGNTTGALPIANGGTGQTTVAAARNALGLGNTSGALPVANGGTGTTDGTLNGVKLGTKTENNVTKYGYYVGSTFKAFKDPTGTASAGDVLSGKTFANAASDTLVEGTMANHDYYTNALSYGTTQYNFYARIPKGAYLTPVPNTEYPEIVIPMNELGNATTAQVLATRTFTSSAGRKVEGTMYNYSGSNRKTVTPTGGTGTEQLSLSAGYHDSVIVDRTAPYNAGKTAGLSTVWNQINILRVGSGIDNLRLGYIDVTHVSNFKITWSNFSLDAAENSHVDFYFVDANLQTINTQRAGDSWNGIALQFPAGTKYLMIGSYISSIYAVTVDFYLTLGLTANAIR